MLRNLYRFILPINILCIACFSNESLAQVIPDKSTNTILNTQKTKNSTIYTIKGGTKQGKNLFHKFKKMDISRNNSVIFKNSISITNIIGNIQDNDSSSIDGSIKVAGPANLFLLNSKGFIFGPNANLNLQGSLLVSTANKLNFSDGFTYFLDQANEPISTTGEPFQLVFTKNSGSIQITGSGHQKLYESVEDRNFLGIVSPSSNTSPGLKSAQKQRIAFLANKIEFDGGITSSSSGNIEISSISEGKVNLISSANEWFFDYSNVNQFNDISLNRKSLIEANGSSSSRINLYGENIRINNGSLVLSQTNDNAKKSNISVNAKQSLYIQGTTNPNIFTLQTLPSNIISSITSLNLSGSGTDISINANEIVVKDGGAIRSASLFSGSTGNIELNASERISVLGFSNLNPLQAFSSIGIGSFRDSIGGSIIVNTTDLTLKRTGAITSGNFGLKQGGNIDVSVNNTTEIDGFNPVTFGPSLISSLTFSKGKAGNVSIDTKNLFVSNGGAISTSTLSSGNSGDVSILTSSFVVDGKINNKDFNEMILPTGISASGDVIPPLFQDLLGLPAFPSGNSGNIKVESKDIQVSNKGLIIVSNFGTGNAGEINISTNKLSLDKGGTIAARSSKGNGGNIQLLTNTLLSDKSTISTSARGSGSGGNITIDSDLFVAFGDSTVSANAVNNKGGNITFNTDGFFSSLDTQVTATSELGTQSNGTITFNIPETDLELTTSTNKADLSKPEISSICRPTSANSFSEFFISGEGGLPIGAEDLLISTEGWHDSPGGLQQPAPLLVEDLPNTEHIDDAQGWVKNPDGTMSLVAVANVPITKAEQSNKCNAQNPPNRPTATHSSSGNSPAPTFSARPNSTETQATAATYSSTTGRSAPRDQSL